MNTAALRALLRDFDDLDYIGPFAVMQIRALLDKADALAALVAAWDEPGGMQDHIEGVHNCGEWEDATEGMADALAAARRLVEGS